MGCSRNVPVTASSSRKGVRWVKELRAEAIRDTRLPVNHHYQLQAKAYLSPLRGPLYLRMTVRLRFPPHFLLIDGPLGTVVLDHVLAAPNIIVYQGPMRKFQFEVSRLGPASGLLGCYQSRNRDVCLTFAIEPTTLPSTQSPIAFLILRIVEVDPHRRLAFGQNLVCKV